MRRITLLFLLATSPAFADLGPELSYLADTPVSRLEFALTRWETDIIEWISEQETMRQPWARSAIGGVALDTENDRIQFYGSLSLVSDPSVACAQFIDAARDRFSKQVYGNPLETMFGERPWDPPAPNENLAQAVGMRVQIMCFAGSYKTEAPLIVLKSARD